MRMIRSIFGALAMMALAVCAAMPAAAVPIDPGINLSHVESLTNQSPVSPVETIAAPRPADTVASAILSERGYKLASLTILLLGMVALTALERSRMRC